MPERRWDVLLNDQLRKLVNLSADEVRAGLTSGKIQRTDLVRVSGQSDQWIYLSDVPSLNRPPTASVPNATDSVVPNEPVTPPEIEYDPAGLFPPSEADSSQSAPSPSQPAGSPSEPRELTDRGERPIERKKTPSLPSSPAEKSATTPVKSGQISRDPRQRSDEDPSSLEAFPAVSQSQADRGDQREFIPGLDRAEEQELEEEDASISRDSEDHVEEIELAAMVDIAFQLILFFLVTATVIYLKSLSVPDPEPDDQQQAIQQPQTLDELEDEYIVVRIETEAEILVDDQVVAPQIDALIESLRDARDRTGRDAMLLDVAYSIPLRMMVQVVDAANEISLPYVLARPVEP